MVDGMVDGRPASGPAGGGAAEAAGAHGASGSPPTGGAAAAGGTGRRRRSAGAKQPLLASFFGAPKRGPAKPDFDAPQSRVGRNRAPPAVPVVLPSDVLECLAQMLFAEFEGALMAAQLASNPAPKLAPVDRAVQNGSLVCLREQLDADEDDDALYGGAYGRVSNGLFRPLEECRVIPSPSKESEGYRRPTTYPATRLRCIDEGFPENTGQAVPPEVDNTDVLRPLRILSKLAAVNRSFRDSFRPFHIVAMFR